MARETKARPVETPARVAVVSKRTVTSAKATVKKALVAKTAKAKATTAKAKTKAKRKLIATKPRPDPAASLADRVTGAIERELDMIETIVVPARGGQMRTEAERRARTLASLARTLAELQKLRGEEQRPAIDDDRPRDLDELRQRLCERLERKFPGETRVHGDGDVEGGDELPG
jgi:hypothetical protein